MRKKKGRKEEYRLYFSEGTDRFYLLDIIAHDGMEHPVFTANSKDAMTFPSVEIATNYGRRLRKHGYMMHIQ